MRSILLALMIGTPGCSLVFEQSGDAPMNQPADGGAQSKCPGEFVGQSAGKRYLVAKCSSGSGLQQIEAQDACQALGGVLAVIETTAEHQFLLDVVLDDGDLWIGLRNDEADVFFWDKSSTPVTFFCGEDGCASTFPSLDGFLCFVMDFGFNGAWRPTECEHTDDYLCEIPL